MKLVTAALTLTNPEHLSATYGTYTLGCWLAVLHSYGFGILHFSFGTALHTIGLH